MLTNSWDCGYNFSQFEFVENRSFTGGVQTDHENSHLLFGEKPGHQVRDGQSHFVLASSLVCNSLV